MERIVTNDNVK